MKFISWNVNGLRACLGKGFADYFAREQADFFCLQETKMQPGQADFDPTATCPTGTAPSARATPVRPSLPGTSPFA